VNKYKGDSTRNHLVNKNAKSNAAEVNPPRPFVMSIWTST